MSYNVNDSYWFKACNLWVNLLDCHTCLLVYILENIWPGTGEIKKICWLSHLFVSLNRCDNRWPGTGEKKVLLIVFAPSCLLLYVYTCQYMCEKIWPLWTPAKWITWQKIYQWSGTWFRRGFKGSINWIWFFGSVTHQVTLGHLYSVLPN